MDVPRWRERLTSYQKAFDQARSLEAEHLIEQRYAVLLDRLAIYFQNR